MRRFFVRCLEAASATATAQLERADVRTFRSLTEAQPSGPRKFKVILVTEGKGNKRDRNFYTARAIESGPVLFEGARCFLNHQTEDEEFSRPEQDIRKLCGFFVNVKATQFRNENGLMVPALEADFTTDNSEAGKDAEAKALAAIEFNKLYPGQGRTYAGFSINADGLKEGTVALDGEVWNNITGFANVRSVDLVTRPARGGAFVALLESEAGNGGPNWRNKMDKVKQALIALRAAKAALKAEHDENKRPALEADVKAKSAVVTRLLEAEEGSLTSQHGEDEAKKKEAKAKAANGEEAAEEEAEEDEAEGCGKEGGESEEDESAEDEAADGEDGEDDSSGDGADEPDGDEPADGKSGGLLDQLKKAIPRGSEEAEEDYTKRLKGVVDLASPKAKKEDEAEEEEAEAKKGKEAKKKEAKKEAVESMSVEDLKKKAPGLYSKVREAVRAFDKAKVQDFKKLKESLADAQRELVILKTRTQAEAKLREANIPDSILAADALLGRSGEEMDGPIKRTLALMRGEDFGGETARGAARTREASADLSFEGFRIAKKEKKA